MVSKRENRISELNLNIDYSYFGKVINPLLPVLLTKISPRRHAKIVDEEEHT